MDITTLPIIHAIQDYYSINLTFHFHYYYYLKNLPLYLITIFMFFIDSDLLIHYLNFKFIIVIITDIIQYYFLFP